MTYEPLGKHIQLMDIRNTENISDRVLGININKYFMPSVANVIGTDLSKYKLLRKGMFACNPMHVGRDERLPVAVYEEEQPAIVSPAYFTFEIKDADILNAEYLMLWFRRPEFDRICWLKTDGSVRGGITWDDICRLEVPIIPLEEQLHIVWQYQVIADRIALKEKINDNLEQQVQMLYRHIFVDQTNKDRVLCRADEYFNISIGKTPPRKEPQWFSNDPANCVWVSISDMGNCGMYICNSSEYLTHDAIQKFNVKLVPDNTVILSFKLTVGRIAITDGVVSTNEAIAHFVTENSEITEYLYCYLTNFNYQEMGSTSSIATAVNSKIIKEMNFVVPTEDELHQFHNFAAPLFSIIKNNLRENLLLASLRDALLPRLMSGEMGAPDLDI